jgi:predicted double-glycine peptidase
MWRHFALFRRISMIAVVVFVTVIAGVLECWAADRRAVRSLLEIRRESVVIQEWDLSCGAAALATVLKYQYGDLASEKDIARALINRREYIDNPELLKIRQGFSLLDLKRYVDNHGYRGTGYGKLTFADLVEKAPIIIPVNFLGYNHFVVFRGVREDRVLLADPGWGNRTMLRGDFENAWLDYGEAIGKVGFVAERRDGIVPPHQLSPKASDFVMLR